MIFNVRYKRVSGIRSAFKRPSLTEQNHKNDCDLNVIMDRYMKTGVLDVPSKTPVYGDFTNATDFREAQNLIVRAREAFEALPSKLRDRFDNDPVRLMEFLDDPSNEAEARSLGLLATVPDAPDAGARDSRVPVTGAAEPGATADGSSASAKVKEVNNN